MRNEKIGFVFPVFFVDEIALFIDEMVASLHGLSGLEIVSFIFFNNVQASFFAVPAYLPVLYALQV